MLPGLVAADLPADAVEVACIADAFGVKGWFKVHPYSADPQAIFSSKQWFLVSAIRGPAAFDGVVQVVISDIRHHADAVVAHTHGIDDRDTATALRGVRVFISRANFPSVQKDEYYWIDLIGLSIINRQGQALGVVRDLLCSGPQSVLVIDDVCGAQTNHTAPSVERLIPFVSAYIDDVDLASKRITVDWQADD